MKKYVLGIISFFLLFSINGQSKVDSLLLKFEKTESNREKIDVFINLGNTLTDKQEKITAFENIFPLAEGELSEFSGSAYLGIGIVHHNSGEPDSAIMNYEQAIPFLLDAEKNKDLGSLYNNLALLNRNKIDTAIYYGKQSHKYRTLSGDSLEMAHGHILLGDLLDENGVYSFAMNHYLTAVRIYEDQDFIWGQINTYNNLAILYGKIDEYGKNIEYCKKTIEKIIESGDSTKLTSAINNLGNAYSGAKEFDLAIETHKKAIEMRKDDGPYPRGESFYNIGDVYYQMGEYDLALMNLLKGHELFTELGSPYVLFYSENKLGAIYLAMGNIQKAELHLVQAHEYGLLSGALPDLKDIYESLSSLYEQKKEYNKAFKFHKLFTETKDSIYNQESIRSIRDMSAKFDSELQASKIDGLEKDAKIQAIELQSEQATSKAKNRIIWIVISALVIAILLGAFAVKGFIDKKKANVVIQEQKNEVEEKNQEILDSISYAKRIQNAILPPTKLVKEYLKDSFILYKPKDIVAGDFYWMEHVSSDSSNLHSDVVLFAAADCTGHGVPGAMVSVVCNNALNRSVREYGLTKPGEILDKTREIVIQEFEKSDEEVKDGMDIALCSLGGNQLLYAGAHNPLWIIRKNEIIEIKADKQPIGKFDKLHPYTTHSIELQKGDTIYIFSDGYVDQFGGERGKKFKTKAFRALLLSIQEKPMEEQRILVDTAFEDWRGETEQIDDVCVIGVRV